MWLSAHPHHHRRRPAVWRRFLHFVCWAVANYPHIKNFLFFILAEVDAIHTITTFRLAGRCAFALDVITGSNKTQQKIFWVKKWGRNVKWCYNFILAKTLKNYHFHSGTLKPYYFYYKKSPKNYKFYSKTLLFPLPKTPKNLILIAKTLKSYTHYRKP